MLVEYLVLELGGNSKAEGINLKDKVRCSFKRWY